MVVSKSCLNMSFVSVSGFGTGVLVSVGSVERILNRSDVFTHKRGHAVVRNGTQDALGLKHSESNVGDHLAAAVATNIVPLQAVALYVALSSSGQCQCRCEVRAFLLVARLELVVKSAIRVCVAVAVQERVAQVSTPGIEVVSITYTTHSRPLRTSSLKCMVTPRSMLQGERGTPAPCWPSGPSGGSRCWYCMTTCGTS